MSSQYGELQPTKGWDWLTSLEHPVKFQRVSRLGLITAPMLLNESQPNFAQCLAISLAGTVCIHFGGCCPLTEFCQVQNSLCVQVLHSAILSALLHVTGAVGISQTLPHSSGGRHLYSAGRPSHWALAHVLVDNEVTNIYIHVHQMVKGCYTKDPVCSDLKNNVVILFCYIWHTTTITAILWPSHRTTCIRWHPS